MKKLILLPAILALALTNAGAALAASTCCVVRTPGIDAASFCESKPLGVDCPSGEEPIDCSLDKKCSQWADSASAGSSDPAAGLVCCREVVNSNFCYLKSEENPCTNFKPEVRCADYPRECADALQKGTAKPVATAPQKPASVPIVVPRLNISIPTLDLSAFAKITQGTDEQGRDYIVLPFIAVYLAAAYRLGVGIAAVLAVMFIMAGGFIWLASAGDASRIKQAKDMIRNAVVGLMLATGSYLALQTVNPELTNLQGLRVTLVRPLQLEVNNDYQPEVDYSGNPPVSGTLPPSQYDALFAKYAPCAEVDPQVLKAIAIAESGLKADRVNPSGYIGLFQTKAANCPASVASYCTDLMNPENNIAAGSAMIKRSVTTIRNNCPNANAHDQMVMIYVGHNMGGGMLQYVTKKGCDLSAMRQAAIDYYVQNPKTARAYAPKYQKGCLGGSQDDQKMAECTAGPKFDYAVKTADKSGVSQVLSSSSIGTCPY